MKVARLSHSNIEYLINPDGSRGYVWNFASGCQHGETGVCPVGDYCWARKITERFKAHYPKGFEPDLHTNALLSPLRLKVPARIGVCFMGDLFGDWLDPEQEVLFEDGYNSLKSILHFVIRACPQHTFFFLTKAPWNLKRWGPWPQNAWVGATAWDKESTIKATWHIETIDYARRWLSFEPLLGKTDIESGTLSSMGAGISWLVIGALTGTRADMEAARVKWPALTPMPYGRQWSLQPPVEWVREIVEAADKVGVKVWLKNNLRPSFGGVIPYWALNKETDQLSQELPERAAIEVAGPYLRQALPGE